MKCVQLNEFHTAIALPAEARVPGTYAIMTNMRCNGVISSLFVQAVSAGATLQVNYYETTTGDRFNERADIASHTLVDENTALQFNEKIHMTDLHSNLRMEAIVTGGTVTFGVMQSSADGRRHEKQQTLALLLEQSRFLVPANYDRVESVYSGDDLTLNYYEDTFLVAKAELKYTSQTDWEVEVEHYLLDDDGDMLLDDDGSPLLLE